MSSPRRRTHAAAAAVLIAVLTVLSVMVPLLDRGRDPSHLVLAAPGTAVGYVPHHHGVCLQHGAAGWTAATGPAPIWNAIQREASGDATDRPAPDRSVIATHLSRAPPLV